MHPVTPAGALVGRESEMALLTGLIREVSRGRGSSLLIEGEPGIGKSALMQAAVAQAPEAGCQVFWGAGDELGQALPLLPFLDGLRVREPSANPRRDTIVRLLRGEVGADRGADVLAVLAEQLLALVTEQCAVRPTILVIDDLQWADQASITLWGRLARSAGQVPLLLVGMMRPAPQREDLLALRRVVDDGARLQLTGLAETAVADLVAALAGGLMAAGIGPGDRVALMSRTRYEWTLIDYACWAAGAVTVPVYETSSAEQVEWILSDSSARAVFAETGAHAEIIGSVRDRLPALEHLWMTGELDVLVSGGAQTSAEQLEQRRTGRTGADLASIVYTSGTTGRPKGCELTHGNLLAVVRNAIGALPEIFEAPGCSTLLFLPLAHALARVVQVGCVESGAILGHWPDIGTLADGLSEFRPTFLIAVPRVFEKVYESAQQQAAASKATTRIFAAAADTAWATISPVGATIAEPPIISQPSSTPHLATPITQAPFW